MSGVANGETSQMPGAWTDHGVSLGFSTCARITVPLAPDLGLIVARVEDSARITAAAFNRFTIFNSREFVAHHPAGLPTGELRAALRDNVWTQRHILPIIREASLSAADQESGRRRAESDPWGPFD